MADNNLSALSDEDLVALKSGDLSKVSDSGLLALKKPAPATQPAAKEVTKEKPQGLAFNAMGAVVDPVLHVGSQMIAKPVSEVMSLSAVLQNLLTGKKEDVSGFKKEMQDAMTWEPRSTAGKAIVESPYNPINAVGKVVGGVAEGAGNLVRSGGEVSATSPRGMVANALQEAVPQSLGFVGVRKAPAISKGAADALNAATYPVRAPVNAMARGVENVIDPLLGETGVSRAAGRTLNKGLEAGGKYAAVEQALMNTPSHNIVPGSKPTAATVAAPAGSAELSALEAVTEGRRATPRAEIDAANEGARQASIGRIAKTDTELETAKAGRESQARTDYGAVEKDRVIPDKDVMKLLARPSAKDALRIAREVVQEKGVKKPIPAIKKGMTVGDAQLIKEGFDDLLKTPEQYGIGAKQARAIGDTRTAFIEWLNEASPGWETARTNFAANSSPINRMMVGRELQKQLTNTLGTAERPTTFANAVENAPRTLKRATGQAYFDTLNEVMTPAESRSIRNVVNDLAREAESKRLSGYGSESARRLVSEAVPNPPSIGMFSQIYSVARAIANRLEGRASGKVLDKLAQSLETPQGALDIMHAAGVPAKNQGAVIRALMDENVIKAGANALPYAAQQGDSR